MAVVTTVRLAEVERARRLDAEYFNPAYAEQLSQLDNLKTQRMAEICLVSDGNHASVSELFSTDKRDGPRYLRGQDIGGFFLGDRSPVFIPSSVYESLKRSHMKPGDVLLSIVGTIGALSLIPGDTPPLTGSCKIAILRPREKKIAPQYLAAFLASKFGQLQIQRQVRGAVQTGLILEDLKSLRVARLAGCENLIAKEVDRAYERLASSKAKYARASHILEENLGISEADLSVPRGYGTSLSNAVKAARWDAEFYKPKYQRVIEATKNAARAEVKLFARAGILISHLTNGQTPLHHDLTVGEVPFLAAENVSDFRVDFNTSKRILLSHHKGELARTALQDGDVLLTIKGKIGNCAVVTGCPPSANINQDVALIRLRQDVHPYFFAAWFNSAPGRQLVEQYSTGGINPFLGLGNLRKIPFPILDSRTQNSVGELVQNAVLEASSLERTASLILQGAISRVESEIEG